MSTNLKDKSYCTNDAILNGSEFKNKEQNIDDCTAKLNSEYIDKELAKCEHKTQCQLDFSDPEKYITGYKKGDTADN